VSCWCFCFSSTHPWLILCVKKHEWKRSVAANKSVFLQPMRPLKQGLKLKLLQGPNEGLWSNLRAGLWCWNKNGGTWTLLETAFTSYFLRKIWQATGKSFLVSLRSFKTEVSKLLPAGQIRPAKPFHLACKDILSILEK